MRRNIMILVLIAAFNLNGICNVTQDGEIVLCQSWLSELWEQTTGHKYLFYNSNSEEIILRIDHFNPTKTELSFYNISGSLLDYCWLNEDCAQSLEDVYTNSQQIWNYEQSSLPSCCENKVLDLLCNSWLQEEANNAMIIYGQSIQVSVAIWYGQQVIIVEGTNIDSEEKTAYSCEGDTIQWCGFGIWQMCDPDPSILDFTISLTNNCILWEGIEIFPECLVCTVPNDDFLCNSWIQDTINYYQSVWTNAVECSPPQQGVSLSKIIDGNGNTVIELSSYSPTWVHDPIHYYNCNGDFLGKCVYNGLTFCDQSIEDLYLNPNKEIIWDCSMLLPNCEDSNCELHPSFTIQDLNAPPDNSLDREYQLTNTSTASYDSLAWWSSSQGWFGWGDDTPLFYTWPEYEEQEEEICLQLYNYESGVMCDSMICQTITIPCTNYTTLITEASGNNVEISLNCDCNVADYIIDYDNGNLDTIPFIDFPSSTNYIYTDNGAYNLCVTLTSNDLYNCTEIICDSIYIGSNSENYSLDADKFCIKTGESIVFNYTASPLGQNIQLVFGDGVVHQVQDVQGSFTHTYDNAGIYNVRLVVNDEIKDQVEIFVKSCGWYGFVYSTNGYRESNEEICDFIVGDGRAYIPPSLSEVTYYWTNYSNIQEFDLCGDEAILEARIKVPSSEGGISCFDSQIRIIGKNGIARVLFTQTGCQFFARISAAETTHNSSNTDIDELIPLTGNFNDWANLKIKLDNQVIKAYYNDELRYTMTYEGDIGQIMGISFRAKGSSSIEWIRLLNIDENIIYEEDFSNCLLNDDEDCVEYDLDCESIVSTSEFIDYHSSILVYPNPSLGLIRVKLNHGFINPESIRVVNVFGQAIIVQIQLIDSQNLIIDIQHQVSGVYFVNFEVDGQRILKKVVISK